MVTAVRRWDALAVPMSAVADTRLDDLNLRDGMRLRVRPIGPEDRERLLALFARLSEHSRYQRFLGPKVRLSDRELAYLTDIDHRNHEALAAIDERDGSIVAVARYAVWQGEERVADVSFAVADELHGHGIGTALTCRLLQLARANRITRLTASTFWTNAPALALLKRLAFRVRDAGNVIDLDLDLRAAGGFACR
jgi:RimJ/RimL family protein N-acetyltransferase